MTRSRLIAALWLVVAACAPSPPPHVSAPPPPPSVAPPPPVASAAPSVDDSFRLRPPDAEPSSPFTPPLPVAGKLKNGIPVYVAHMASPFVAIRVVAAGGQSDVGPAHIETANLLGTLLRKGTKRRTVFQLKADYLAIGMEPFQLWMYPDGMILSLVVPIEKLQDGVGMAAEVAFQPLLDKAFFERVREQIARVRETDLLDSSGVANHVLRHVVFGSHHYSGSVGTPKETRAVRREDLVALHQRVFDPRRMSIVVTGSVSYDDVVSALDDAFGKQAPGTAALPPAEPAVSSPASAARVVLVDVPGNSIAAISVGAAGPRAGAPESESTGLALSALTDPSLGRLPKRLRDDLGYTSQLTKWDLGLRASGLVSFYTRVASENVGVALKETDAILRAFAGQGPSEDEVKALRDRALSWTASAFETTAEADRVYGDYLVAGQPPDMAVTRKDRLAQVTAGSVKAAAAQYLDPDRMRYVVAGDAAALKGPLEALGWGPVEVRGTDGVLVHSPTNGKPGVEPQAKRR
jgi:predicted Zn-dependent peptidase